MTWLDDAKKRVEKLGDIPDSLRVLAPEDGVEFLKASSRITNDDAPRALALLVEAAYLLETWGTEDVDMDDSIKREQWFRDLEEKEAPNA